MKIFTECDVVVLVYDISSKSSFLLIVELFKRILTIKKMDDVPLVVVGTHSMCDPIP
jgi:hypothetical protein